MDAKKKKLVRMARRQFPEEDPEFQIAPMIDILLVLLVFFMSISSTEALQSNKEIALAVAGDAKNPKDTPGQIIINITWLTVNNSGSISVNDRVYPVAGDLVPLLQRQVRLNPLSRVLIRADKSVRYEYMRTVLQAIGRAGVSNVTFSVVDKEGPGS